MFAQTGRSADCGEALETEETGKESNAMNRITKKELAVGMYEGTVQVGDLKGGQPWRALTPTPADKLGAAARVALTGDGKTLAVAYNGGDKSTPSSSATHSVFSEGSCDSKTV